MATTFKCLSGKRSELIDYKSYHRNSLAIGDIDPSYSMLKYICERFELNNEQRYWLAWIYATCYCGATTFYIYNEFPDFENVNVARLERWWKKDKNRLVFQTDRRWVYSRNQLVGMFDSYRRIIGSGTQAQKFNLFKSKDRYLNYRLCWDEFIKMKEFGRFAMFLYLEAVHVVTGFPMEPQSMSVSDAESCRNGLALAINAPQLNTHESKSSTSAKEMAFLQIEFDKMVKELRDEDKANNVWNIETTLCAYKKYRYGKRYVGYYLDRQHKEISLMQERVTEGVDWSVLWDYRRETFDSNVLAEHL